MPPTRKIPTKRIDLSKWENNLIKIPTAESADAFQDFFENTNTGRRILSMRRKRQEDSSILDFNKRRKLNSLNAGPAFFETNRRTVLTGKAAPRQIVTTAQRKLTRNTANKGRSYSISDGSRTVSEVSDTTSSIRNTNSSYKSTQSSNSTLSMNPQRSSNSNRRSKSSTSSDEVQELANVNPLIRLSRRETFSASHRLHNPKLTDQQNAQIYDKCNHLHGHNYVVYVILRGPIDTETGMVYNIADLKKEIAEVIDTLDHRNLDEDVEFFKSHVSTVENIALYIASTLKLSKPELLYKVKVCETEKNTASVYLNN